MGYNDPSDVGEFAGMFWCGVKGVELTLKEPTA